MDRDVLRSPADPPSNAVALDRNNPLGARAPAARGSAEILMVFEDMRRGIAD